jgi:hypothetical protein
MFGYIIANKPELKIREYERYQQYYCGLCRGLHQEYGALGQLSLSFDMTFLAMLLTALYEPETKEVSRRCAVHPLEKKPYLCNPCITYAAQMNLLLTYYKCADDWKDEKKLLKGIYGQGLLGEMKKLQKAYPDQCARVKQCLAKTSCYEKRFAGRQINEQALDAIAAQSGQMMAEIFAWRRDEWEQELRQLGFYMGKYIYLLDAYDDLEQDQKKNLFNPLVSFQNRPDFDEWVYGQLMMLATGAAKTFEELPVIQDAEILRNILYAGIWTRYFAVKEKRRQKAGENPSRQEGTIDSRE